VLFDHQIAAIALDDGRHSAARCPTGVHGRDYERARETLSACRGGERGKYQGLLIFEHGLGVA
jgi:hypothetical protein